MSLTRMSIIGTVAIVVALISVVNTQKVKVQCDADGKDRLDAATRWLMFFGEPGMVLPETEKELPPFCREAKKHENYVRAYSKQCLGSFAKQVTRLLMYGISKKNRYYCTSKPGKREVMVMAGCGNRGKEAGKKCMNQLGDELLGILRAPKHQRMALVCCNYYKFEQCLESEAVKIGPPACTDEAIERLDQLLYAYTGEMINYICYDYKRDDDKCVDMLPKTPIKLDATITSKSLIPTFIDVLESV